MSPGGGGTDTSKCNISCAKLSSFDISSDGDEHSLTTSVRQDWSSFASCDGSRSVKSKVGPTGPRAHVPVSHRARVASLPPALPAAAPPRGRIDYSGTECSAQEFANRSSRHHGQRMRERDRSNHTTQITKYRDNVIPGVRWFIDSGVSGVCVHGSTSTVQVQVCSPTPLSTPKAIRDFGENLGRYFGTYAKGRCWECRRFDDDTGKSRPEIITIQDDHVMIKDFATPFSSMAPPVTMRAVGFLKSYSPHSLVVVLDPDNTLAMIHQSWTRMTAPSTMGLRPKERSNGFDVLRCTRPKRPTVVMVSPRALL